MKPAEIKQKNPKELSTLLGELQAKLVQFNFDLADKKLKDTSQIKKTKQDMARVLTAIRDK